jgi:DNA-binding MarR family transcriptional regulator
VTVPEPTTEPTPEDVPEDVPADVPEPTPQRLPERGASTASVRRPATEAEARVLASALRLRIIRLCLGETLTNKEIALRLGRDPASVLHHVRRLVETGFLEALPLRRGSRGAKEIPYRSTGKSWTLRIEDAAEHQRTSDAMLHAFLEELADAHGELADAMRLGLRLRAADRAELHRRIAEVLEEFKSRTAYDSGDSGDSGGSGGSGDSEEAGGEWWSVFVAIHRDRRGAAP